MRIALTTWGFPTAYSRSANGIGIYTAITAKYMAALGHEVTVITTHADGMPPVYSPGERIRVFQSPYGNLHWYLSKLPRIYSHIVNYTKFWEIARALVRKFWELNKIYSFDVVEVGPPTVGLFPWLADMKNVRVVTTLHGCTQLLNQTNRIKERLPDRYWNLAELKAAQLSELLISPSQYIADFYTQAYSRTPVVLPLPVESLEMSVRKRSTEIRILALGGTGLNKGSDIVISALRSILAKYPHVTLSIVSADKKPEFIVFRSEYDFSERINLLPWLAHDEMMSQYFQHDIFVSASRFETFGMSVAEAMMAGMAVAASDIPPHSELLKGGAHGFLFRTQDCSDLIAKLKDLILSSGLRRELGQKAHQWAVETLNPTLLTTHRLSLYSS